MCDATTSQDVTMHGIPGPDGKIEVDICEWAAPEGEHSYDSDMKSIMARVTFKAQ